ncbi:MAG: thioredoxin domain-containing protein [Phycisphaeraceae bacterium]|nr:thioredoxin domain-containing protein [Phycisphaeraceae bacterium]
MSQAHDDQPDPASGGTGHTNALADSASPYLLQHAHNPVDWRPWGPDALAEARERRMPIFLSVGYSTCYWCHVMEREVFEDEKLAALLNERFVAIKVDREERPDLDEIYMTAVQAYTQMTTGQARGGWPMSVFLTPPGAAGPDDPGLEPFYAGTYIPPRSAHGMPGFDQVVIQLGRAWEQQRDEVIRQAKVIGRAIRGHLEGDWESAGQGSELDRSWIRAAVERILGQFDARHGGFGGAPKFPEPSKLGFLLEAAGHDGSEQGRDAVERTLWTMAHGGICDQIGGGFHRYSVDHRWLVPHFEKMLYDNAQLLEIYARAAAGTKRDEHREVFDRVLDETACYALREMVEPEGGFRSAQDAEVDSREGLNYLWTGEQIRQALADHPEDIELALVMFGLDQGPNFQDPHRSDDPPTNVLYLPLPLDDLATKRGQPLVTILAARERIRSGLLEVRQERKQPRMDDKVIVSWNGMMIAGLCDAGRHRERPEWIEAAQRAAAFILSHMRDEPGAGLIHSARRGQRNPIAFLEDYAFFIHGLLALHQATRDRRWLDEASGLMELAIDRYGSPSQSVGGFYDTVTGRDDLLVRNRSAHDGATPSANAQMAHNLIELARRTGQSERYPPMARSCIASFASTLAEHPYAMPHMLAAMIRLPDSSISESGGRARHVVNGATVTLERKKGDVELDQRWMMTIIPDEGYFVYAQSADPSRSTPLQIQLCGEAASDDDLMVEAPEPEWIMDDQVSARMPVYRGPASHGIRIRSLAGKPSAPRSLKVMLGICGPGFCLAPQELVLPLEPGDADTTP